jgi:hypothetical protein
MSKKLELTPLPVSKYYHPYHSIESVADQSLFQSNHLSESDSEEDLESSKPIVLGRERQLLFLSKEWAVIFMIFILGSTIFTLYKASGRSQPFLNAAWSSRAAPFSTVDPVSLGFIAMDRPDISKPGPIFGDLLDRKLPLPTNSWYENFLLGMRNDGQENKVFQVPYILDTGGNIPGVRTHACHVQANNRAVMVRTSFYLAYFRRFMLLFWTCYFCSR